jgi:hypothetical protein
MLFLNPERPRGTFLTGLGFSSRKQQEILGLALLSCQLGRLRHSPAASHFSWALRIRRKRKCTWALGLSETQSRNDGSSADRKVA